MSIATRIYAATPIPMQNAAVTAYGALLRSRRHGGIHRRTLQELLASQWLEPADLASLQLDRFNAILRLTDSIRHYRESGMPLSLESLSDVAHLPTMGKADLRKSASVLTRRSRFTLRVSTGGTTGTPLSIYCDRAALQRNYAFFERFRIWAGVPTGVKVATFAGRSIVPAEQRQPPFWRYNRAGRAMLFSSYHLGPGTLRAYVDQLSVYQPDMIDSYPSNLEILARFLSENAITSIRPRAIITSSETLAARVRQLIEEAFDCTVFDHYGSAEMVALVTQCASGAYHVNPEFGFFELIDESGAPIPDTSPDIVGEVVATGFINQVMPLVRYRTGDRAAWADSSCACGRHFPVLNCVLGRVDDVVVTPEGYSIGRLDPIFKGAYGVLESRVVQDAPDHLRLELVPGREYRPEVGLGIVNELRARVGPSMAIDVHCVESIPRSASGKLRAVVNEVTARGSDE